MYRKPSALFLLISLCLLASHPVHGREKKVVSLTPRTLVVRAPRPPVDSDLALLAPAGSQLAIWLDVRRIHDSPVNAMATSVINLNLPAGLPEKPLRRLLREAHELLVLSGCTPDGAPTSLTIIRGAFDGAQVLADFRPAGPENDTVVGTLTGIRLREFVAISPTPQTVAIGTPALVEQIPGLLESGATSLRRDPSFEDFSMKGAAGVLRLRTSDVPMDACIARTPFLKQWTWVHGVRSADAILHLADGALLESGFTLNNDNDASTGRNVLTKELRAILSNPLLRMFNIGWVGKRIRFAADGPQLTIRAEFRNKDITILSNLIEPLLEIQRIIASQ